MLIPIASPQSVASINFIDCSWLHIIIHGANCLRHLLDKEPVGRIFLMLRCLYQGFLVQPVSSLSPIVNATSLLVIPQVHGSRELHLILLIIQDGPGPALNPYIHHLGTRTFIAFS